MDRPISHTGRQLTRRSALRLLGAGVVGLGLAALTPVTALADPAASYETETALEDALTRYEQARLQLDALGAELEALTVQIDETEVKIAAIEANIAETERQANETSDELSEAREVLSGRMSAAYKAGNAGMLDVVLSSSSMEELVSGVYYLDKVAEGDRKSIEEVTKLQEVLARQQASLGERRERLDALREQQEQQRLEVEEKHAEAQALLDALDVEVKELMARREEEIIAAAAAEQQARALSASDISGDSAELRANVVNAALKLLGVPYIYGGTYPTDGGTDCSGLVQWAFAQCGVSVPRTTYTQAAACRAVGNYFTDASLLLPGDLIFCNKGGHVVLYIGDGLYVHEPMPGSVCCIASMAGWADGYAVGYGFPL